MAVRQIFEFTTPDGKTPVSDFLHRLDLKFQIKIGQQLERLCDSTCPLQPPLIKAVRLDRYKGLYELRTRSKQTMTRIIFCFDSADNIILLHGFVKKQDRATNQALEVARARKLALASKEAFITRKTPQGGSYEKNT